MTDNEARIEARKKRKPERVAFEPKGFGRLLKDDPELRLKAAQRVGARIVGQRATCIVCPTCGRSDIWFLIDGRGKARCNHVKTCGAEYWLDELLRQT